LGHWLWASEQAGLTESNPTTYKWAGSSPAIRTGLGPSEKQKNSKNSFQKSMIFRKYFTAF